MREYKKPEMIIERFVTDMSTSATDCQKTVIGTTDPDPITVYCVVGGQPETVFQTGCTISATSYRILEDVSIDTSVNVPALPGSGGSAATLDVNLSGDYFIWQYNDGTAPTDQQATANLTALVQHAGVASSGAGWHYAAINASGDYIYTNS